MGVVEEEVVEGERTPAVPEKSLGVYVRPSAAIERGSGFFIPGLEGGRVRLFVGGLVWCLLLVNQAMTVEQEGNFTVSNYIAAFYASLLLLQAAISSFSKRLPIKQGETPPSSEVGNSMARVGLEQKMASLGPSAVRIQWSALTILSLTPATQVVILRRDQEAPILFAVGTCSQDSLADDSLLTSELSPTLDALLQAGDGRMSLPQNHPLATMLLPSGHRRSVVLHRIPATTEELFLVVGSNQPIDAYTANDLRWLERLADYIGRTK